MIKVLADQNLYKIEQFIPEKAHVTLYGPQEGIPDLDGFDAFLVQTVTPLSKETLPNPPKRIKFIGTGSSGTDHIHNKYFEQKGITIADAKGCNAPAVAEYVITALLLWREKHQPEKKIEKVGVIGAGKAGSAVIKLLQKFGIEYAAYDPPRAEVDAEFKSATLDEVLDCPILTFHVPLTKTGPYATFHWLDEAKLSGRKYRLIINAARGGVIDEKALLKAHTEKQVEHFVLDVWENEPDFNTEMAERTFIATPHIAGYSEQSKINATQIICDKLATYFELDHFTTPHKMLPKIVEMEPIKYDLKKILRRLNPILEYEKAFQALSYHRNKKLLFRKLRNDFPFRFEYPYLKISNELFNGFEELRTLGVQPKVKS
ncbi:MAG: 4-phosphoerythronate dehydrogenase [Balneolaceae bacterium]